MKRTLAILLIGITIVGCSNEPKLGDRLPPYGQTQEAPTPAKIVSCVVEEKRDGLSPHVRTVTVCYDENGGRHER